MNIRILSYRAADDQVLNEQFSAGHKRVLSDFGIENVTSNNNSWKYSSSTYVIVAIDKLNNEVVGGVRLETPEVYQEIPLFSALSYLDDSISQWLATYHNYGISEVCGLWNAKRVFGKGISPLLTMSAVALCGMIPSSTLIGIAAPYTREMSMSFGFQLESQFGNSGYFPYPNERHWAAVMSIGDVHMLSHADEVNRQRIFDIRSCPNQQHQFSYYPGVNLQVEYNL